MSFFTFKTGMCAMICTLYGCAPTIKVSTDYDRAADFSSYHTFTLVDISAKGEVSELNAYRIRRSITEVLTEKGFVETGEDADLLVNAMTIVKTKREITASTDYYGYGGVYRPYGYWGGSGGTTTFNSYDYKDGSLIIDVVNKKAGKLLWQGIGNAEVDQMPDNPDQFMLKAVRKILAGFPPTALNR
jgi:hypothetical protein